MLRKIANRYWIEQRLKEEKLYKLFCGTDTRENRPVSISMLNAVALSRPLENLLRYRKVQENLKALRHPHLLSILEFAEEEGSIYVISESTTGWTPVTQRNLNIEQKIELIREIAGALDATYQQKLLHGGLNTSNILINEEGAPKLTGFGLNMLLDLTKIMDKEEIREVFGYLSPEGTGILRRPLDQRSDLYSLGIIFYELITGRLPYQAKEVSELIYQHIAQVPISPKTVNLEVPPIIEKIILHLIAKDPADRYQTAAGLIYDLEEYQRRVKELAPDAQRTTRDVFSIDFEIARQDRLKELNFSTRLIGRDKEIAQLKDLLNRTKENQGSLCFVYGEPGIGKSRLVDELRTHIHGLNGLFCGGKCYHYEFRTPYKVFSEAIDAYIEKVKRLSQEEQQEHIVRIKQTLGELGGEVVKIAPAITELIGQPPKLVELEPEKEKIRFFVTVTNFLVFLSTPETPLLMFLDDLQWIDDGSLEILERLAEKLQNTATTLIISYRENEVDQNHPLAQLMARITNHALCITNIPIKSFTLAETTQMIGQILMEKEEVVLPLAQELNERAKGNPFFTLELLHTLVDTRLVYLQGEHYTYALDKLKTASLPATIVDAVLNRMKDLSEEDLQIISYASVMGKEIEFNLLLELTNKPAEKIVNSLEDGIQNQLLFRDLTGRENIFFMHDRIRDAFYKCVPEEERVPLHKRIGEAIEQQNQANPAPVLYDLAYHFNQAKEEDKALQYSLPAALKAKSSYANVLAMDLYNTAKEILERRDKKESKRYIEVLENLGEVYRLAGRFEESLDVLKICGSLIPVHDELHRADILSKMGYTFFDMGEHEESAKVLEQALKILQVRTADGKVGVILGILKEFSRQLLHTWFPKVFVSEKYRGSPKDLIIARLIDRLAHIYYFSDLNKTFYFFLRNLNLLEKIGPCPELAYSYVVMGAGVWSSIPWFSRAFRDVNKGLAMSKQLDDRIKEGCAYAYLAWALFLNNKPKESVDYADKAIPMLKSMGEYWDLGVAFASRAFSGYYSKNPKEYLQKAEEFVRVAKELKILQNLSWAFSDRSRILSLIGEDMKSVIEDSDEALKLAGQTKDEASVSEETAFRAYYDLRREDFVSAIENIEQATKLFSEHNSAYGVIFAPIGAQIYLDHIVDANLPSEKKKFYLKRASWFCKQSFKLGKKFQFIFGWAYQVNGTYLWLRGRKKKAITIWDKGLFWLRTNKNNPGGDKYRIAYILLEEAKFLLQDNPKESIYPSNISGLAIGQKRAIAKAYENLLEARDLFTELGCKMDLETTNKLLESITPEGVAVDSREVLTQRRHLDSLLSVAQAIGSIFILDELLQRILEYGLKVTGAERGFLLLFNEKSGQLQLKVSHGLEKELQELNFSYDNYKISFELIKEVTATNTASIADQTSTANSKIVNELKDFSVRQAIGVPLQTRERLLGVLYLDNRLAVGTFGKDEVELMKAFSVQSAICIDNTRLVASMVEQERLKQELELGREIQGNLLPKEPPQIAGLQVAGLMEPAKEIGGDYYDYIVMRSAFVRDALAEENGNLVNGACAQRTTQDARLAVVIGDVSGKGVGAGLIMATAKATLKGLSQQGLSPRGTLGSANRILHEYTQGEKFMTMLYLEWDSIARKMRYSSAGHEHIIIYRSKAGSQIVDSSSEIVDSRLELVEKTKNEQVPATNYQLQTTNSPCVEVIPSGGFILGMLPEIEEYLEDKELMLNPGDKIVLYTDGITEAHNESNDMYSLERLAETVKQHGHKPCEELLSSIKADVYGFIGQAKQYDDITLVVMEAE